MNKFSDRLRAAALAAACLGALAAPQCIFADEPACPANSHVEFELPVLAQVPYIGHLFRVTRACAECPPCAACPADAERIGVDFEFCQEGNCPLMLKFVDFAHCEGGKCEGGKCTAATCATAKCAAVKCDGGKCATGSCAAGKCAAGQCEAGECVAACECPAARTTCQVALKASCACGDKCNCGKCACGAACQCTDHAVLAHPGPPVPYITHHFGPQFVPPQFGAPHFGPAPFVAHAPPPHPAGCPAMFEHLVSLAAKSAALEAKLEARAEQAELVGEMLELAQENAKLKAQVELAEAKAELAHEVLRVTLENEKLKSQVAELTSKLGSEVRTTERSQERQPR